MVTTSFKELGQQVNIFLNAYYMKSVLSLYAHMVLKFSDCLLK
jgi:hypothetical protein